MENPYITIGNAAKMTREEWLEKRELGIGGSDASAAVGLSRYKSQIELYLDKFNLLEKFEGNELTEMGNLLEEPIAQAFMSRTGLQVQNCNLILQSTQWPWMRANLDRRGVLPDGERFLLEIKNTGQFSAKEWEADEAPAEYLPQLVHQMLITGYKVGVFGVLVGGRNLVISVLDLRYKHGMTLDQFEAQGNFVIRDLKEYTEVNYFKEESENFFREYFDLIIDNESDFWNYIEATQAKLEGVKGAEQRKAIVLAGHPPVQGTVAEYEYFKKKTQEDDEIVVDVDPEYDEIFENWQRYKQLEKEMKASWQGLQAKFMDLIDGHAGAEIGTLKAQDKMLTWKWQNSAGFKTSKFQKDHPETYNDCFETTSQFNPKILAAKNPNLYDQYRNKSRVMRVSKVK